MQARPSETRLLLERLHGGDRAALEELLARDLEWIRGYVRRRLGKVLRARVESGDVVQEAVIEFLRHGPPFLLSDRQQFRRLAARVVENVLGHQYDWFTAQRREFRRDRPLPSEDVLDLDARRGLEATPSVEAQRRERESWTVSPSRSSSRGTARRSCCANGRVSRWRTSARALGSLRTRRACATTAP